MPKKIWMKLLTQKSKILQRFCTLLVVHDYRFRTMSLLFQFYSIFFHFVLFFCTDFHKTVSIGCEYDLYQTPLNRFYSVDSSICSRILLSDFLTASSKSATDFSILASTLAIFCVKVFAELLTNSINDDSSSMTLKFNFPIELSNLSSAFSNLVIIFFELPFSSSTKFSMYEVVFRAISFIPSSTLTWELFNLDSTSLT
ncbi:hypothetical protein BpHYR1_031981 [Brachionus plicatilis]|uniref:Uncharacterized protein n=1 Tax=Brachionus plicatilis TaxID=10195 RepID=A0A3M7ST91_BRAPC|nr:hypothetical protein BpHYR1_031981 [Brachionus plicatilis]